MKVCKPLKEKTNEEFIYIYTEDIFYIGVDKYDQDISLL